MHVKPSMAQNYIFVMENMIQPVTANKLQSWTKWWRKWRVWVVAWVYHWFRGEVAFFLLLFCTRLQAWPTYATLSGLAPEDPPRSAGSFSEQRLVIKPDNKCDRVFCVIQYTYFRDCFGIQVEWQCCSFYQVYIEKWQHYLSYKLTPRKLVIVKDYKL